MKCGKHQKKRLEYICTCSVTVQFADILTVTYYLSFNTYKTSFRLLCSSHISCLFYCVIKRLLYVAKMFFYQLKKKEELGKHLYLISRHPYSTLVSLR
jgi:hypothetical protein